VSPDEIVSLDLAREMCFLGEQLRRRIGVLINRQGRIEEVILGTKDILFLPDLGRYRLGRARLRNLRLVFTDLTNEKNQATIPYDIYTDLERLRFDAVVGVRNARNRTAMAYAYLIPANGSENATSHTENVADLGTFELDFREFIGSVEQNLASEVVRLDADDQVGAVIVGVYDGQNEDPETSQLELRELARTAGVTIVDAVAQKRKADPKTYVGSGKLEELVIRCIRVGADMLIFDTELKPSQWRAITNSTEQ
jgi:GTP-binding protein HflX